MRITVLKENYTIKDEYSKIAEFYDAFHAGIFLNQLMDDAYEDGKITLKVAIDFPECDTAENNADDRLCEHAEKYDDVWTCGIHDQGGCIYEYPRMTDGNRYLCPKYEGLPND